MRRACDFFSPLADALASASASSSSASSSPTSSADEFEAPSATDGSIVSIALSADGRRVVCAVQRSSLRFDRHLSSSRASAPAPPAADTAYTSTVGGVTSIPSLSPSRPASLSALHVSSVRWHPTAPPPATGAICCVDLDSRRTAISAECSAAPVRVRFPPLHCLPFPLTRPLPLQHYDALL
jgi:hypothetical protein